MKMEKEEVRVKIKEIIIETLNLNIDIADIDDNAPLFGTDKEPGLFSNSLCVLEVTSALVGEFDVEPSSFNSKSFETISSLTNCIYDQIKG